MDNPEWTREHEYTISDVRNHQLLAFRHAKTIWSENDHWCLTFAGYAMTNRNKSLLDLEASFRVLHSVGTAVNPPNRKPAPGFFRVW